MKHLTSTLLLTLFAVSISSFAKLPSFKSEHHYQYECQGKPDVTISEFDLGYRELFFVTSGKKTKQISTPKVERLFDKMDAIGSDCFRTKECHKEKGKLDCYKM